MPAGLRLIFSLLLTFSLSLTMLTFTAQDVSAKNEGGDNGDGEGEPDGGGIGAALSLATTKTVSRIIKRDIVRCQLVAPVYRFDCYRQAYRSAASYLNGRPAYADAQEALILVEKALDQIVARHADTKASTIRRGVQKYRPIKPSAIPQAKAELTIALDQATTILLRAPERTGVHYARIAEAVNSNKVLLRSRLYRDGGELLQTMFA